MRPQRIPANLPPRPRTSSSYVVGRQSTEDPHVAVGDRLLTRFLVPSKGIGADLSVRGAAVQDAPASSMLLTARLTSQAVQSQACHLSSWSKTVTRMRKPMMMEDAHRMSKMLQTHSPAGTGGALLGSSHDLGHRCKTWYCSALV